MNWLTVQTVTRGELQRLLRDRKALFFALILPLLLYPLLFWGSDRLGEISEERLEEQRSSFVADLAGLPDALAEDLRASLNELGTIDLEERALDELRAAHGEADQLSAAQGVVPRADRFDSNDPSSDAADGSEGVLAPELAAAEEALLERFEALEVDVALLAAPPAGDDPRPGLTAVYKAADEAGNEGADRVEAWVREREESFRAARFDELFGGDPGAGYALVATDLASGTDSAGLAIGKFLPLIAIFVLVGSGAFAALEAFAAEREVGTLETLLVQPVDRFDLAFGKFGSVAATATVAWLANTASFLACGAAGLLGEVDVEQASGAALFARVGLGAAIFFPTVLLMAALLSVVSARARSFREGQNYLLPVTLLGAALAAPSATGDVELDPLLALAPVLGPSLAMRDALAGSVGALSAVLAVLSSC
ncbi:MAG: ABC transporter permease subunit, partial [Planctomycetota bacterium]